MKQRPYSAAFVVEMSSRESFTELSEGNGFTYYIEAVESSTIYEIEQLSIPFNEQLTKFVSFIQQLDENTKMYQAGNKLVELLKLTKIPLEP